MATRSSILYSAAAVRRMLNLSATTPVQIQEFLNVVWVWVKGQRPTFISKQDLKSHFVEYRKAEAQTLKVTDWLRDPPRYAIRNPQTGSQHIIIGRPESLDCDCKDYYWQKQFFGRGCCKHGYAVLNYLGYDSLRSYVAANRPSNSAHSPEKSLQSVQQLDLLAS